VPLKACIGGSCRGQDSRTPRYSAKSLPFLPQSCE